MKKTDNVIKKLLHLKEDYNLDLSEDKKDSQIILEDDTDEELDDKESSSEKNDTESKEVKNSEEKKPEDNKESADTNKESKTNSKTEFKIDISPIYEEMQSAKSPTDVALVLKKFLDTIENSSLEALSQKKD